MRPEEDLAKRVSVINFKGGVGKTTLAFNLAAGLARFHSARVLLVDMDHQSSLSIVCLGAQQWTRASEAGATVTSVFRKFLLGSSLPGREIIHPVSFRGHHTYRNAVSMIPADLDLDDTEIRLTSYYQGFENLSDWNKRTLICRWLEANHVDDGFDYIVFDCAPATKIVTQNAIAASHGYIVPVVPEAVMERGAPHLSSMIRSGIDATLARLAKDGECRPLFVPKTALVGLVVTRVQRHGPARSGMTNDHTQHLRSLERQWSNLLLRPYVYQGTGVGQALAARRPVYDHAYNIRNRRIDRQFEQLTAELKSRIDRL